jgi:hypothetical protein
MTEIRTSFDDLEGDAVGAQIAREAVQFQEAEAESGRRVDIVEAVKHVTRGDSFDPENPRDLRRVAVQFQEAASEQGNDMPIENAVRAARLLGAKRDWNPDRVLRAADALTSDGVPIMEALRAIAGKRPEQDIPLLSKAKSLILQESGRRELSIVDAILELTDSDEDPTSTDGD